MKNKNFILKLTTLFIMSSEGISKIKLNIIKNSKAFKSPLRKLSGVQTEITNKHAKSSFEKLKKRSDLNS